MTRTANGAEAIVSTLADLGITACFANPGTSEMHLVAALDREPRIRSVLCLFEGVATGAADGFARIAGAPAMTLLHLGPGYANGGANLHNARRAFSPVINIVGDHATDHASFDAPLQSDIAAQAATSSVWVGTVSSADNAAGNARDAYCASLGGGCGPATLILPADFAWQPACLEPVEAKRPISRSADGDRVRQIAKAMRSARSPALLLGSHATSQSAALSAAGRIAAWGAAVFHDTFVARQQRGGDHFAPRRMRYFSEEATSDLAGHDLLLLAATSSPVAFFAYPDKGGSLIATDTQTEILAEREEDVAAALILLADELNAPTLGSGRPLAAVAAPTGPLTPASIGTSLARHMPAGAIVSDDAVTSSGPVFSATATASPHDWLFLTGGAIGQGLPVAIGAALAKPEARTIALSGDGAAMYTLQSLWTMAREKLDLTVIIFANQAYRILDIEFARTGAAAGGHGTPALLDLGQPELDWRALARGMGVSAVSTDDAATFDRLLAGALKTSGPILIEARIA